jgi:hypothetical protein
LPAVLQDIPSWAAADFLLCLALVKKRSNTFGATWQEKITSGMSVGRIQEKEGV